MVRRASGMVVGWLALVAVALGVIGCGVTSQPQVFRSATPGTLTVVTPAIPTPGFFDGTPQRISGGYEYALAQDLADDFGIDRVDVRVAPFQDIVAGRLGGADLALGLITPTDDRRRGLDFSDAYFTVPPAVLVPRGDDVPDLATARDRRWVVVASSTLQDIVAEVIDPRRAPLVVTSRAEVLAALQDGRADTAIFDLPLALGYERATRGAVHVTSKLEQAEPIAAALPKDSPNTEIVSAAIRRLAARGELDDLAARWLGDEARGDGADIPILRSSR